MAAAPKYLAVKKWDDFQHHHDGRRLPWIKLYDRLLEDYDFAQLSETQQLHLVKLWMLANRVGNKIRNDPVWIRQQIRAKQNVNVAELRAKGWLITWRAEKKTPDVQGKDSHHESRVSLESVKTNSRLDRDREVELRKAGFALQAVAVDVGPAGSNNIIDPVMKLVEAIKDSDEGTERVVRQALDGLPMAAALAAKDALEEARAHIQVSEAGYVVNTIRGFRRDGIYTTREAS